jgi:hypothetical protein
MNLVLYKKWNHQQVADLLHQVNRWLDERFLMVCQFSAFFQDTKIYLRHLVFDYL